MADQEFQKAAEEVKKFTKRPSDEEMLEIYGLYKQATTGDNTTSQPWAVQLEARAKWDSWTKYKGMSSEEAKRKYVELVNKLKPQYA